MVEFSESKLKQLEALLGCNALSQPDFKAYQSLFDEYKIHLMPKSQNVYDLLQVIFELMNLYPALRESIATIKVSRSAKSVPDEQGRFPPIIVIYPKPGKTARTC